MKKKTLLFVLPFLTFGLSARNINASNSSPKKTIQDYAPIGGMSTTKCWGETDNDIYWADISNHGNANEKYVADYTNAGPASIANSQAGGGCMLVANITSSTGSCAGASNGSATVTASGGTTPYTYSWAPSGGNNATASNLAPATYTVTVNDLAGCTATASITITQGPVITSESISAVSSGMCNGNTLTVTSVNGGTSPYTYLWEPSGQTTSSISGLGAGGYTVTITDRNGCTDSENGSASGPTNPVITTTYTNVSCNGLSDGKATASATGGVTPYTYSWSPGGQTTPTKSNLTAGTYTITVTANTGCFSTAAVIITQPAVLSPLVSTITHVSCYAGNNGNATLTTSGGTTPYTYTWAPIGGTNATGTGLTAGTYTVTVTDINSCSPTSVTKVVITQPAVPVKPTISANPGIACYAGTTTATITTSGGTSPYTYSWAPIGGTNATGTGLTVGTYTVTIVDNNNCSSTAGSTINVVVTQPAAPVNPTISANPGVACYAGTTTATITTTGGTSPYTYSWAPIGGTNATGTGLTVGTYTVTIVDNNNCSSTAGSTLNVVVTQPAAPVNPTISANPGVACYAGTTTATITTTGGTSPYTYSWAPIGGTNATGTGLTVGTYTVTIVDNNNCSSTAGSTLNVIVTQPAAPVAPTISANPGIACYAGTTTATITTSGGTSPYTYSWAPIGGTNATGTGLTVGTYTVTIVDQNNCSSTAGSTLNVVVTQPAAPVNPTISANPGVACYAGTTTATITTTGGTSPYTYSWAPIGGTNATGTGLTVGTYTVTIVDQNNCSSTAGSTLNVVVTQPAAPVNPTISANPGVACYAGTTTATITTTGGTSPYTYSWAPIGGTNATGTGLTVGTYTVTIVDNNNCSSTAGSTLNVIVTQPAAPVAPTISANPGIACYAGTTTATITTSGGTSPYTYSWAPIGGTNATGTGLTVGTYTVTIVDNNNCSSTAGSTLNVVVTQPAAPVKPTISANPGIACYAGTTTATITTSGGTSPYTYSWAPIGGTNATGTGLTVGTYTVTIVDNNNCSSTAGSTLNVVVTQPAVPVKPTISANPGIACYAGTTTATITTSGGTSPYTYSWAPIGGTNATGTGLTVGTYTVTIVDQNNCSSTAGSTLNVVVTQPAAPVNPTISANPGVACYAGTTTATITTTGGTSPYTYSWAPIGGTNATGTGLTVGTYTVTIVDQNNCSSTAGSTLNVVVTQPAAPVNPTISANPGVACYAGTTTATITTTGGTSPYTYSWAPIGGTNATGTGLTVGTYTVTIVDQNNCSSTAGSTLNVIVTQPAAPVNPTISANPGVACYAGTTTATITTTGGTSPYTYSWAPIGGTNATGTGLTVGTYTVTIVDNNNCSSTAGSTINVVVTQPAAPVNPTISANPGVACYAGTTTATITTTGGTSPYTYSWAPIGGTNATGTGLTVGTYTVTIVDNNNCSSTAGSTLNVVVTQPAAPVNPTISANPGVACYAGTTTATITTTGGTSPYTYSWAPIGGTNATGTGLTVGTYTVTIVDQNNCSSTAGSTLNVVVTQPAAPVNPTISANPGVACYAGTTTATITTTGGTSPYTYSWAPIGGTNATGTGLTVGTYTVTIVDNNNCSSTAGSTINVVVTQPAAITSSYNVTTALACYGSTNGVATITPSGGTPPYTYLWTPSGQATATGTGLSAGTYSVAINDQNGCGGSASVALVTVSQPTLVTYTTSVFTGIRCNGGMGDITATVTGGTPPYTYLWIPSGQTNAKATGLTSGTYSVTVTDQNGCLGTTTSPTTIITITQPSILTATATVLFEGTCGQSNGSATVTTNSGGTPPYFYLWTPSNQTTATATGLSAGTYTVVTRDNNGCSETASINKVVLTQPPSITAASTINTEVSCYGYSNGVATIIPAGGTQPYTYLWAPSGQTSATATGLSAGTYIVSINDINGCGGTTTTVSVSLTQPTLLAVTANAALDKIRCNGASTGIATAIATGGTLPYTYTWVPSGQSDATATGLSAGTYTVTINDAHAICNASAIVIVTQPTPYTSPIIQASTNQPVCSYDSVTLTAEVYGGLPPLTYTWNPGNETGSTIKVSNNTTTIYTVMVNTPCGPLAAATQPVQVYPIPTMTVCCNTRILLGEDTVIQAGAISPTNIVNYSWSQNPPGISANTYTGPTIIVTPYGTTTYIVTGTDADGCQVKDSVIIQIEVPCGFTVPNVFTPTYPGLSGIDNEFYINAPNADTWTIDIFDRWGVQLYQSNDQFEYWNGTTKSGGPVPAGVYYYIINGSCQGKNFEKTGYVQLVR